jgi:hypothetical protein
LDANVVNLQLRSRATVCFAIGRRLQEGQKLSFNRTDWKPVAVTVSTLIAGPRLAVLDTSHLAGLVNDWISPSHDRRHAAQTFIPSLVARGWLPVLSAARRIGEIADARCIACRNVDLASHFHPETLAPGNPHLLYLLALPPRFPRPGESLTSMISSPGSPHHPGRAHLSTKLRTGEIVCARCITVADYEFDYRCFIPRRWLPEILTYCIC